MSKNAIIGTLSALMLVSPAIAMTPTAASADHAKTSATSTDTHKTAAHEGRQHRVAMNSSKRSGKEVHALNVLEAAGYRQFNDLHPQDGNFVGTARKRGKEYDVTVSPSGSIRATAA